MSRIFAFVVSFAIMTSGLYGIYVPGTLTFTFTPNGNQGTSGSWQAIVISADGDTYSTGPIDHSIETPVSLQVVSPSSGLIELGCYVIELVCRIDGPVSGPFLDLITVQCTSSAVTWDTITYRDFPTLANGENSEIYYSIPSTQ